MRPVRLLIALLAVLLMATMAPAMAAPAPTITVDPTITSRSAYRVIGVPVSAANLTGTSADLLLDGELVRSLPVAGDGTITLDHVTFPTITRGQHTLGLRQGGAVVASAAITVAFDPFEVVPRPIWITAEKLRDEGVVLSGQNLGVRTNFIAQVASVRREAQSDVNGRLEFTIRTEDELLAPGLYPAGVFEQPGNDPNRLSYRNLRVTVLDAVTRDRGTVVEGSGFAPESEVQLLVGGQVQGSAVPNSDGVVRIDAPVTATVDVTLRGPSGEVTRSLSLTRRADLTAEPTPAEVAEAARIIQAAQDLQATSQTLKERVEEVAQTSGASSSTAPVPVILPNGLIQDEIRAVESIYGTYPGATTTQTAGGTLSINAGGLQSQMSSQVDRENARIRELLARTQSGSTPDLDALLAEIAEAMRNTEAAQKAVIRSSTPELIPGALSANGVATVPVPSSFRGLHQVAVVDLATGIVTVSQQFQVATPADGTLPNTGSDVGPAWIAAGALAAAAGAVLLVSGRRRRYS
ncbi:LPXTG cell wall anchor domain-containing protein [Aeromicrobium alkaliterrae]|uniref:Gram-positive cocci surface proteins LPxTG domain-containing protein n=1 Tax=Aeromicrobium alkaliterrae TaxID=302168 RepID=A0ABP4VFI5_9ACTN